MNMSRTTTSNCIYEQRNIHLQVYDYQETVLRLSQSGLCFVQRIVERSEVICFHEIYAP